MKKNFREPLVSVCITAYNHAPYIAHAIESALEQHCSFDYEIVVGVDLSTDATADICREFEKAHADVMRVSCRTERLGMRANYRTTIEECRGTYIAFLDGDDFFTDPEKLQDQVDIMSTELNPALCYSTSRRMDESGHDELHPKSIAKDWIEKRLGTYRMENCTVLARKSMIMEYYSEIRPETHPEWMTEDLPMWLYLTHRYPVAFIPGPVAVHRILPGSVSHCTNYMSTIAFCDSLNDIFLFYDRMDNHGGLRFRLILKRENDALWLLSREGTYSEFMDRWKHGIAACPWLVLNPVPIVLLVKKLLFRHRCRR